MPETREVTTARSSLGGLIDALDAVIADGVVVAGDVVIALDGIDLIRLDLRLLLAGIEGVPAKTNGEVA
jgi:Gas vesicle protein